MELPPDKPSVSWKYHVENAFNTPNLELSLAYPKHAQNTYMNLQLDKII